LDLFKNTYITEIEDVVVIKSEKGELMRVKNRFAYGLSFCREGKITYNHNGREFVSDSTKAVIIPRGATYSLFRNETGRFPLINFQCEGLNLNTFQTIDITNLSEFLSLFESLGKSFLYNTSKLKAFSILYDILSRLERSGTNKNSILNPAIAYIEENISSPEIRNETLAEICGISEVYFRSLFKKEMGLSPRQYCLDLKMKKAKELLSNSNEAVSVVSEMCGFSSPYHFSRAFSKREGVSPIKFRKDSVNKPI
jgi:AraC-like DNA-binding protein